jgi:recombination protein RecR
VISFPSKLLEEAVNEFAKLPGIGKRTAMRLVLHLLKEKDDKSLALGNAILAVKQNIKYCKICHNVSESDVCLICNDQNRDKSLICIVEDIRDFMAIESTGQFNGVYHILGGIISPMDGIGPNELNIESLVKRITDSNVKEIIMALSTTIEGDTTIFYIYKRLKNFNITISTIAKGVAIGDELEYTDEITLGRSIVNRIPYDYSLLKHNI